MTNIIDLYNVLTEMRKSSSKWLTTHPDDKVELHRCMTFDEVLWMIEDEDFFKSIEDIYMKEGQARA